MLQLLLRTRLRAMHPSYHPAMASNFQDKVSCLVFSRPLS